MKKYLWGILKALTQLLNAFTGGDEDQSFSGRTGIAYKLGKRWAKVVLPIIDWVFKKVRNEDNHCFNSIEWDEIDEEVLAELEKLNEIPRK